MRVEVDQQKCNSCGYCVNHAGEVFDWNAQHKAEEEMSIVPKDFEDVVSDAVSNCPTQAIREYSEITDPLKADARDQNEGSWILD